LFSAFFSALNKDFELLKETSKDAISECEISKKTLKHEVSVSNNKVAEALNIDFLLIFSAS